MNIGSSLVLLAQYVDANTASLRCRIMEALERRMVLALY